LRDQRKSVLSFYSVPSALFHLICRYQYFEGVTGNVLRVLWQRKAIPDWICEAPSKIAFIGSLRSPSLHHTQTILNLNLIIVRYLKSGAAVLDISRRLVSPLGKSLENLAPPFDSSDEPIIHRRIFVEKLTKPHFKQISNLLTRNSHYCHAS